jgi:hypothetical protein
MCDKDSTLAHQPFMKGARKGPYDKLTKCFTTLPVTAGTQRSVVDKRRKK